MDKTEILSIGNKVMTTENLEIEQERFPLDKDCNGTTINGVYYLQFNEEATVASLHDYIFEDKKNWEEK